MFGYSLLKYGMQTLLYIILLYSVTRGSLQKNALQKLQLFNSIHCNSFTKAFGIITFRVFVLAVFIVQRTNMFQGH